MFLDCFSENDPCTFPLSSRLIQEKTKLGRNARMLAVQSFERNKADQVRLFEFVRKKKDSFFVVVHQDIKCWFMVPSINASNPCRSLWINNWFRRY
jgi:hypothetical protein